MSSCYGAQIQLVLRLAGRVTVYLSNPVDSKGQCPECRKTVEEIVTGHLGIHSDTHRRTKISGGEMKKTLIIVGVILLVILVAAGSFWGGMAYQTRRASQISANFMNARGLTGEGQIPSGAPPATGQFQPGGAGFPGGGATGPKKSIQGGGNTSNTPQGVT